MVETSLKAPCIRDLGAGTGLFSAFVMQKIPHAKYTLIDLSEKMIELARSRFSHVHNVQYLVGDYTQYAFSEQFDIVISSLSIHHLTHPKKRKLFCSIYELLSDNGIFVNADQALWATSSLDSYYKKRWEASVQQSGLSDEAIAAAKERRLLDRNATASDQIRWLHNAGFVDVDCPYKHFDFAVFCARKTVR